LKNKKQSTVSYKLEQQLYQPIKLHLESMAFVLQKEQMPFYEYKIDIYSYCEKTRQTVAVELKLSNFAKAVRQALLYQLCSDLVYIAMPLSNANRCEKETVRRYGIGIIGIDDLGGCTIIENAAVSSVVRCDYKRALVAQIEGV
jgi:hypothetical protein